MCQPGMAALYCRVPPCYGLQCVLTLVFLLLKDTKCPLMAPLLSFSNSQRGPDDAARGGGFSPRSCLSLCELNITGESLSSVARRREPRKGKSFVFFLVCGIVITIHHDHSKLYRQKSDLPIHASNHNHDPTLHGPTSQPGPPTFIQVQFGPYNMGCRGWDLQIGYLVNGWMWLVLYSKKLLQWR